MLQTQRFTLRQNRFPVHRSIKIYKGLSKKLVTVSRTTSVNTLST